jgi:hypothetical protein
MIGVLSSEALKLWQRSTLAVVLAMIGFMAVTMIMSVPGSAGEVQDRGPAGRILTQEQLEAVDGLARTLGNGITFLGVTAVALVAMNVGNSSGSIFRIRAASRTRVSISRRGVRLRVSPKLILS